MSELRWTLLILGVVFIAGLSWWERRRPRQAFAPRLREGSLERRDAVDPTEGSAPIREPWIGDTELSDAVLSDGALRTDTEPSAPGPLQELPTLIIPDEEEQVALRAAWDESPPEPKLFDPEEMVKPETARPNGESLPPAAAADANAESDEAEIIGAEGVGTVRIVEPACGAAAAVEPLVEWPPEEARRIVALRLVAPQPERFPGRALRLALAAEGFVIGKFSIFHKPDESNRAVLSAASLTRPGAFDLEAMDLQRYSGLSLFAVLPGPRTPAQAFEGLLASARNLNERLQGALQDERGGPLTPLRVASIRESLKAEAAGPSAAAAHET